MLIVAKLKVVLQLGLHAISWVTTRQFRFSSNPGTKQLSRTLKAQIFKVNFSNVLIMKVISRLPQQLPSNSLNQKTAICIFFLFTNLCNHFLSPLLTNNFLYHFLLSFLYFFTFSHSISWSKHIHFGFVISSLFQTYFYFFYTFPPHKRKTPASLTLQPAHKKIETNKLYLYYNNR